MPPIDRTLRDALYACHGDVDRAAALLGLDPDLVADTLAAAGKTVKLVDPDDKAQRVETWNTIADRADEISASLDRTAAPTSDTLQAAIARQRQAWGAPPAVPEPVSQPPVPQDIAPPPGALPLSQDRQPFWRPLPGMENRLQHMSTTGTAWDAAHRAELQRMRDRGAS